MNYKFGDFQLDTTNKKLIKNQSIVSDDTKTIALLEQLCESYPEFADKQQLIDYIWSDQIVSDWSLSRLVSDVRQLLEDSGKVQGCIKTIRGKGFKLNINVEQLDETPLVYGPALNVNSHNSKPANFVAKNKVGLAISSLLLVIVTFFAYSFFSNKKVEVPNTSNADFEMEATQSIRAVVMPVVSENKDPIDQWIKYGIMALVNKQLNQYPSIQTIPVSTTMATITPQQENINKGLSSGELFENICSQLGCNQIISLKYRLEANQPILSYQIFSRGKLSQKSDFSHGDIIESTDSLLDSLASELLPKKTIRKPLTDTYSKDNKANRDYAIGVNELLIGDLNSAETYLKLALERQSEFFWAKAYLAEVAYRRGELEYATKQINELQSTEMNDSKQYFLSHLYSNVLYSEGKLEESLAVTKTLLLNSVAKNDPILLGNELLNVGSSLQALGYLDEALDYLQQARKSYQLANYGPAEGKVVFNIGNVLLSSAQPKKALKKYEEARELFKKYNMQGYALMAKHQVATTNLELGLYQNAESELRRLIESYKKIGDIEGELMAYLDLSILSSKKGNYQESLKRVEDLLEMLLNHENTYITNLTLAVGTAASLKLKMLNKAEAFFQKIDGEWFDPRPDYSLLLAYLQHEQGKLKLAFETATSVKVKLAGQWSDYHQTVYEQFRASLEADNKQDIIF